MAIPGWWRFSYQDYMQLSLCRERRGLADFLIVGARENSNYYVALTFGPRENVFSTRRVAQ